MTLSVDTSNSERIIVGVNKDMVVEDAKKEKSQRLLGIINSTLKEKGLSLNDIANIKVNAGPGSFTGLRVGIAVANALGWMLNIPVNGQDIKKEGPLEPIYS